MRTFATIAATAFALVLMTAPAAARPAWKGHPPYGNDMMTRTERKAYWREFLALETDADRDAYYVVHIERMKQRALERGVSEPEMHRYIDDADRKVVFWRPPYFEEIMTDEELANYVPALDALPDRLDRTRFVAEHIRTMYFRALERGVSAPSIEPFDDVFETLGEVAPDKPTRLSAKAAEAAAKSDEGDEAEPEAQPIVP
jgi:hypothetical protein